MVPAYNPKVKVELAPASSSAAATRSANIDTLGGDHLEVMIPFAARVNTSAATVAVVLKEADTTDATSFATWSSSFSCSEDLTAAHNLRFMIDTRARKRYINLAITNGTHTTNDLITSAALSLLTKRESVPAGTAGMCGSTNDVVVIG